ncbi:MAG: glycoside hydrolase family 127 protein [Acidobacteriota bacterium]|nr:MAG: glycoside hydrolase family 127 protein [Acidobacteriota bacterium]
MRKHVATRVLISILILTTPVLMTMAQISTGEWKDKPVLDTSRSLKAVLHGVPVSAVKFGEGFWTSRRKVTVDASLPSLLELFEQKGIIDNFRRVGGGTDVARRGPLYTDSDVYKWLEAIGFVLQERDHPALRQAAMKVIDDIAAAQEQSGYINTYYTRENLNQRHQNMRHGHELYCLGHLIQAGIAWQRATGETKLLDVGRKMADYVHREFGAMKKPIFEGHPEIELALAELYRATGDRKYLELAGYMLAGDKRNEPGVPPREFTYLFTVKPFTSREIIEGHAVRAAYACSGATDYYLETGDEAYAATLKRLWEDMTARKQYITGGIGSRGTGEAFGDPYELPNQQAYTESCAAIATMFWNWRMMHAWPEAKYMDNFERSLYNGANSGLSLDGRLYCYRNPLELTGNPNDRIRNPWYDTTCCPPNLQRIMASLPGYSYSTSQDGLWVHLYHASSLNWRLEDGTPIRIEQKTEYPWKGTVDLAVSPGTTKEFSLRLRIPAWSGRTTLTVNGREWDQTLKAGSYAEIRRTWKAGDSVRLNLDVSTRLTQSNLLVRENIGKVAVERGPLLYCMEGFDQAFGTTVFDWYLKADQPRWKEEWQANLLGGILTLKANGSRPAETVSERPIYERYPAWPPAQRKSGELTFIPYYTFANRGITTMQVWVPID